MLGRFKIFGKVSLITLIFFSIQGEVIQRYVDLFQGKLEHRAGVPKETARRQQLIKLQCFTQKIHPTILPSGSNFSFTVPVTTLPNVSYRISSPSLIEFNSLTFPPLRGPPAINS